MTSRLIRRAVLLAGIVAGGALQIDSASGTEGCPCAAEKVTVIGHRGTGPSSAASAYGENTVEALQAAVEQGATMVELDIQLDADGTLVVMHDDRVDRTTDGTGCVANLTTAEITALDAAVGTAAEGQGHRVPTLSQVMDAMDVPLNLELKLADDADCPPTDRQALASAVVDAVAVNELGVVISSFDEEVLALVESLDPAIETALLSLGDVVQRAADAALDGVHIASFVVDDDLVARAQAEGLAVRAWTENDADQMRRLLELGVDGIVTDEVGRLVDAVAAICASSSSTCADAAPASSGSGCAMGR